MDPVGEVLGVGLLDMPLKDPVPCPLDDSIGGELRAEPLKAPPLLGESLGE